MELKKKIFETDDALSSLIIRCFFGIVLFAHGAQKLVGWFGGYGYSGTMNFFTESIGLPYIFGLLIILLEFFGSILLIIGFATRLLAALFTLLGIGIMFHSHIQNGFFMNWFGNQTGEGIEFFLFWLALTLTLVINGSGKYSLDMKVLEMDKSV